MKVGVGEDPLERHIFKIAFFWASLFLKFFKYFFYSNHFKKNDSGIHMHLEDLVMNNVTTHLIESSC